MEAKILRLLVFVLGFLTLLFAALAIFFLFNLQDIKNSIATLETSANTTSAVDHLRVDVVKSIGSLKVVNGTDGKDGLSIKGADGKDGTNATSTIVVEQQPIQGPKGDKGDPSPAVRVPEFDGQGHWRLQGDEEWLPLFQPTGVVE